MDRSIALRISAQSTLTTKSRNNYPTSVSPQGPAKERKSANFFGMNVGSSSTTRPLRSALVRRCSQCTRPITCGNTRKIKCRYCHLAQRDQHRQPPTLARPDFCGRDPSPHSTAPRSTTAHLPRDRYLHVYPDRGNTIVGDILSSNSEQGDALEGDGPLGTSLDGDLDVVQVFNAGIHNRSRRLDSGRLSRSSSSDIDGADTRKRSSSAPPAPPPGFSFLAQPQETSSWNSFRIVASGPRISSAVARGAARSPAVQNRGSSVPPPLLVSRGSPPRSDRPAPRVPPRFSHALTQASTLAQAVIGNLQQEVSRGGAKEGSSRAKLIGVARWLMKMACCCDSESTHAEVIRVAEVCLLSAPNVDCLCILKIPVPGLVVVLV